MASSDYSEGYGYAYAYNNSSEAGQAALEEADDNVDALFRTCGTGLSVEDLQEGEAVCTPIRVLCTLVTVSVISAWFSRRKCIRRKLLLFFSHWLSGLLHQLFIQAEATMVLVCWAGSNVTGFIKALKFLELVASNMLAITNLGICANLALVIMSHRTLVRVNSLSSPSMVLLSLAVSTAAAVAAAPFWQTTVVSGTGFALRNEDQRSGDWLAVSRFFLEFLVGTCMFVIVAWLLLFRMTGIKECWKVHTRIRYYFGLTLIGTTVNLALGVCGTIYVVGGREKSLLIVLTWTFRHIHIALDTIVLYGVLGAPAAAGHDGCPDARRPYPAAAIPEVDPRSSSSSRPGLNCGASPKVSTLSKASSWKGRVSCSSVSSGSSALKVQVRPIDSSGKRFGQLGLLTKV
ncbi:unnamed protein product [Ectocarpus fasciculatus]